MKNKECRNCRWKQRALRAERDATNLLRHLLKIGYKVQDVTVARGIFIADSKACHYPPPGATVTPTM